MKRLVATLAAAALTFALGASPAGARAPVRYTDHFVFSDTIDCSQFDPAWTFNDDFVDTFDIRGQDYFDAKGNLIRTIEHIHHVSDDVNSVTGFTLHEHNHILAVFNWRADTLALSGALNIMQRPGAGSVIHHAGHKVIDLATGDPLFLAGPDKADDEDFCRAVAP